MPISLDKINNALDRLDNKGGSNQNQDALVKLEEGEHQIRITPYKEDLEMPFRELWFHFRIGGRTFLCPNKMKGEPDPICDLASTCWNEFTKTGDESFKEMFKTMAPTLRVYVPIVVRGQEDKGIRWWSISPRTTYKEVLNHVRSGLRQDVDMEFQGVGHGQVPHGRLARETMAQGLPRGQGQEHGSRGRTMRSK